jgi:hypothetical protein
MKERLAVEMFLRERGTNTIARLMANVSFLTTTLASALASVSASFGMTLMGNCTFSPIAWCKRLSSTFPFTKSM